MPFYLRSLNYSEKGFILILYP